MPHTNKPVVEYYIYKMYKDPELWDGPFKTLKDVKESYAKVYCNDSNFGIFKQITRQLRWPLTNKRRPCDPRLKSSKK